MQNANPDQNQDANPTPYQGTRVLGNPQGDNFTIQGPIFPEMGNGPRVQINLTGPANNHGYSNPGANGTGGDSSSPDGHHALVPDDTSKDDMSGAGYRR